MLRNSHRTRNEPKLESKSDLYLANLEVKERNGDVSLLRQCHQFGGSRNFRVADHTLRVGLNSTKLFGILVQLLNDNGCTSDRSAQ